MWSRWVGRSEPCTSDKDFVLALIFVLDYDDEDEVHRKMGRIYGVTGNSRARRLRHFSFAGSIFHAQFTNYNDNVVE
jgi:hypothetical protein